jgi:hypothetical protein
MAEPDAVTRALLAIAHEGADEPEVAERVCRACVAALDIDGAVISLLTATVTRQTLWATDATAVLLDELQFTLDEGIFMEAATTRSPVFVPDLHHSPDTARWPVFAAAVAEQTDVRAIFALPLQWGAIAVGVLGLYRNAPGALDAAQRRDAISASEMAALMMIALRTDPRPDGEGAGIPSWLDRSFSGRAEIHQATGMVLAQLEISAQDALARMRAHAFVHQRLLLDIAGDIVTRRLVFTDEMR